MGYYINLFEITLKDFSEKLKRTKLLPSQKILKENIDSIFQRIEENDISNIGELQQGLKTKAKLLSFSKKTDIDINYLTVLRREINGLHPEPREINGFPYINQSIKDSLLSLGLNTTLKLFEEVKNSEVRSILKSKLKCSEEEYYI